MYLIAREASCRARRRVPPSFRSKEFWKDNTFRFWLSRWHSWPTQVTNLCIRASSLDHSSNNAAETMFCSCPEKITHCALVNLHSKIDMRKAPCRPGCEEPVIKQETARESIYRNEATTSMIHGNTVYWEQIAKTSASRIGAGSLFSSFDTCEIALHSLPSKTELSKRAHSAGTRTNEENRGNKSEPFVTDSNAFNWI